MKKIVSLFISLIMVLSLLTSFGINASGDETTTSTTTSGPSQTIPYVGDNPLVIHTSVASNAVSTRIYDLSSGYLSRKTTHTTTAPERGTPPDKATQLAFPGAEGFGQFSQGGRGGDVYYVTNLDNDGVGSLRYGITSATGPRTILFAVAGTIILNDIITINKSNITIAGQSAPGEGITLRRYGIQIEASHIILRYIRIRMGDEVGHQIDCLNVYNGENIIIDHISSSWSTDENLSVGENMNPSYRMTNVTVQNTIISECFWDNRAQNKIRGYGSLIRGSFGAKYSYIKNAYIHTARRIPRVGNYQATYRDPSGVLLDFRNNVVYNMMGDWSSYSWGDEYTSYNFVGNYIISGPETVGYYQSNIPNPPIYRGVQLFDDRNAVSKGYFDKNVIDGTIIPNSESRNYLLPRLDERWPQEMDPFFQTIPFDTNNNVTTLEGQNIYDYVMSGVGASKDYDSVDERILNDVRNKTGHYIDYQSEVGGWPTLDTGTTVVDTDLDGMSDSWETTNKLNPNNPNDGSSYTLNSSYTNLEAYLDNNIDVEVPVGYSVYGYVTDVGATITIDTLSAVANANGFFLLDNIMPGTYNMKISKNGALTRTIPITVDNMAVEVSLNSNKIPALFLGDANADGIVNITDIGLVKTSYGKSVGVPGYNLMHDINSDELINVSDVGLAKTGYGKSTASYPVW